MAKFRISYIHAAAFMSTLAFMFSVAAIQAPNLLVPENESPNVAYIGVWRSRDPYEPEDKSSTYQSSCERMYPDENSCGESLQDRCRTMQAFSILGILAICLPMCYGCFSPSEAWGVILGCGGCACLSFMIVWSIAARYITADYDPEDQNCGAAELNLKLGTSGILFVFSWLCALGAVLTASQGDDDGDNSSSSGDVFCCDF